uniref:Uncharacterized protein n=1 Tax=Saccharomyces cerevisiae TaxID=4932 RepID=A2NXY7_YEASX|nr:unknown [Saccharomyces cerevisiae]
MWFEVSVPVLSEQITLTEPKVSTLGNLLTMALRLAILRTPNAKVTVTIIGNPSGIAATAKDTDIWNISNQDLPCMIPTKQIIPITMKLTSDKSFPNLSIVNCNGVFGFSILFIISKTAPKDVFVPVPTTIPLP